MSDKNEDARYERERELENSQVESADSLARIADALERIAGALEKPVAAERERCAKIAEDLKRESNGMDNAEGSGYSMACEEIATKIREGFQPPQADAVAAERERCAKVAEQLFSEVSQAFWACQINRALDIASTVAAKIRSGE